MEKGLKSINLGKFMVFLVNDWTEKDSVLELLAPGWILHLQIELDKLSLGSSHLVILLITGKGDQANILL